MMVKLLRSAYALGVPSSRRIAQRCEEDVAFRVLTANNTPDFRTISDFRRRHLGTLRALFLQVLQCCQTAGLVKLGVVALDGTQVQANASTHKAMGYGRMQTEAGWLEREIQHLLTQAEQGDAAEDQRDGAECRGEALPAELTRRETSLATIRAAMAALEAEAQAAAPAEGARPSRRRGRPPQTPPGRPAPKAQRNFTDPESRIMQNADKVFVQADTAQAAVEGRHQIIVACAVSNQASDAPHAVPLTDAVITNTGATPTHNLGDAGYWSEANAAALATRDIETLLATEKPKHGEPPPRGRIPARLSAKDRMRRKLQTKRGHALYALRQVIVEPVFGLIQRARGFRQFLRRGLVKVEAEWAWICTGHNRLKLFRSGRWATAEETARRSPVEGPAPVPASAHCLLVLGTVSKASSSALLRRTPRRGMLMIYPVVSRRE